MDFCSTDRSGNTSAANNDAGMRKWPIGKPESGPALAGAAVSDEATRAGEVQADSLRHLMDPHFLFNALNGVMHDLLRGERKAGLANLQAFRRLAVDQIQAGRGGWLTLDREWSMLGDYIQLELRRMDRPVDWRLLPIPEEMRAKQIPAFMIQPLVENALWHGLGGTAVLGAGSSMT